VYEIALPQGTTTIFIGLSLDLEEGAAPNQYDSTFLYTIELVGDEACESDAECPAEAPFCANRFCTTGAAGADCADDGDCASAICATGHCSGGGGEEDFCALDRDCDGYCGATGYCQDGSEGDSCFTAASCVAEDAHCPLVLGASGYCTDGTIYDWCVSDDDCDAPLRCSGASCLP
jgi:hypothetical protein